MKYFDYNIEITDDSIKFDPELKLPANSGWQTGDHFELKIDNDEISLVKIEDDESKITRGYN